METIQRVIDLGRFKRTLKPTNMVSEFVPLPFTIAFVYAADGCAVVKGMRDIVERYIENHFPRSVYYITLWRGGKCRGRWTTPDSFSLKITPRRDNLRNRIRYYVSMRTKDGYQHQVTSFRKVPRKWLPLYNQAL